MKKTLKERGQSLIEYLLLLTVILAAVFATGMIDRLRVAFAMYFVRETAALM